MIHFDFGDNERTLYCSCWYCAAQDRESRRYCIVEIGHFEIVILSIVPERRGRTYHLVSL